MPKSDIVMDSDGHVPHHSIRVKDDMPLEWLIEKLSQAFEAIPQADRINARVKLHAVGDSLWQTSQIAIRWD